MKPPTTSQTTTDVSGEYTGTAELGEDERHDVLAVEPRRVILEILDDETTPIGLEALASKLTARETGVDDDAESIDRVAISLHHRHLPKMDALDVLDYDTSDYLVSQS